MSINNLKIFNKDLYTINEDGFISFPNRKKYDKYLEKFLKEPIGRGSEGVTYNTTKDGIVYKKLDPIGYSLVYKPYGDAKYIITTKDFDLDSFSFPIDIFSISDKEFVGYTNKAFNGDKLVNKIKYYDEIDFSNIDEAYNKLLDDVKVLSHCNIFLNDLSYNLLYNEKEFRVVDTTDYGLKEDSLIIYNHDYDYEAANIYQVDKAIKEELSFFTGDYSYSFCYDIDEIIKKMKNDNDGQLKVYRKSI